MNNLGKLLKKRLFKGNRRAVQKAYLFEEYEGLFYVREEFNLDRLGVMGAPTEIVIEGKTYSIYFICGTEDGRRFFVGIEKGEFSDRQAVNEQRIFPCRRRIDGRNSPFCRRCISRSNSGSSVLYEG